MKNSTDSICVRCIISGRVQGVFFRASTKHQAQRLGVFGYAKNLVDGSVEVVACGSKQAVNKLTSWLHQGPEHAEVFDVECESISKQTYIDFQIY